MKGSLRERQDQGDGRPPPLPRRSRSSSSCSQQETKRCSHAGCRCRCLGCPPPSYTDVRLQEKNAASATGAQKLWAIQPSCLCPYAGLDMGVAHSPGMQYRTGGAMTATTQSPEENEDDLLLAKIQVQCLNKKRAYWCVCHVTRAAPF